jgi:hypothetical protein
MTRINLLIVFILLTLITRAQGSSDAPLMADVLRSNGKIYIVIAVIGIVFASIVIFLTLLEKKIKKLEKLLRDEESLSNKKMNSNKENN